MEKQRATWGSKFGFIMSAAGFSVGLGNIWRFSYLAGVNGGGAFVLVYVVICLLIGVPLYTAEIGLGRKTQANPVAGIRSMTKKGSPWISIGWLGAVVCTVLLAYYLVILGWMFVYCIKMLFGTFTGMETGAVVSYFATFKTNSMQSIIWTAGVIVLLAVISMRGLKDGIEKVCKVLMPMLIVMLVVLAVRSLTLPNAFDGVKWFLTPDFSKITPQVCLAALGQAFFSIGIASSCAFIYGSFLKKEDNLITSAATVIAMDTGIALLSGLVIFPALFSFGMEPASGMGLVFESMPRMFNQMPFGNLFGAMFFLLVFIAGLTSAIGYLEGVVNIVEEEFKWSRTKSVIIPLCIIMVLSIPCSLSLNGTSIFSQIQILGKNLFDFADYFSGNILMTINALLISLFTVFVWKFENYRDDVNEGTKKLKIQNWWKPLVVAVVPIAVAAVTITGLF